MMLRFAVLRRKGQLGQPGEATGAMRGGRPARPMAELGFTLVELLIAMVIVAILTAIAIPSYQNYILQARRADAKTALLDLAAREERYLSLNPTGYSTVAANLGYAAFPVNLGTGATPDYQMNVVAATATSYVLQAVPQGGQTNDATCGTYQLDNLGNQFNITGGGPAQTIAGCW